MDQQKPILSLLERYASGNITTAEQDALTVQLQSLDDLFFKQVMEQYEDIVLQKGKPGPSDPYLYELIKDRITAIEQEPRQLVRMNWWAAAAILILLLGAGSYFLINQRSKPFVEESVKRTPADLPPGHEGAILTLADGSQIELDNLENGIVAHQDGTRVVLKDKQLSYDPVEKISKDILYNTMSTPPGRQFRLTLPDGTQVWLNSASSIRYPTHFSGIERKVVITGEAYFEVAKDRTTPFRVNVGEIEVEVLGTHFNVNGYHNEDSLKTTLLEGSVRVKDNESVVTLKPGQQALLAQNLTAGRSRSDLIIRRSVDLERVIAWKNGIFNFNGADLFSVMRELERWYGIEVVFEGKVAPVGFFGKMSRNLSLNVMLEWLQGSGVHLRMEEGKKLIIMP